MVLFSTSFNLDVKSFWPNNQKINSYGVVLCTVPPGNQEWLTRQIPTFLHLNSSLVGYSSLLFHVRYVCNELHQRSCKTLREHAVTLTADVCLCLWTWNWATEDQIDVFFPTSSQKMWLCTFNFDVNELMYANSIIKSVNTTTVVWAHIWLINMSASFTVSFCRAGFSQSNFCCIIFQIACCMFSFLDQNTWKVWWHISTRGTLLIVMSSWEVLLFFFVGRSNYRQVTGRPGIFYTSPFG